MTDGLAKLSEAWRMLGCLGLIDGVFNHISLAHDDVSRGFWMNAFGISPEKHTPESFVLCSASGGRSIDGVNPDGMALHSMMHVARSKPGVILHTHSPAVVAVSARSEGLLAISQTAVEFVDDLLYVDYDGFFRDGHPSELLESLALKGGVAILRNHGLLIVADSIAEAFYCAYYVEEAARVQCLAGLGIPLLEISGPVRNETRLQMRTDRPKYAALMFEAFTERFLD
jgi:ribulose-5-phosphate 4-epimerase/fuculose-1-phosphate aldolase